MGIPREQIVDLVLSVGLDEGGERCRKPCVGIDAVHFEVSISQAIMAQFSALHRGLRRGRSAVQGDGADGCEFC